MSTQPITAINDGSPGDASRFSEAASGLDGSPRHSANPHGPRVLIADDQPSVLHALRLLLKSSGYRVELATGPAAILAALQAGTFDLVLMDLNYTLDTTSGGEGLDLISRIKAINFDVPIVVMTAWATVGLAVEAMRRGACDFVEKPWANSDLLTKLYTVLNTRHSGTGDSQERMERAEATEIQRKLVRLELPQAHGCEISGDSRSLRFVGGDYCNIEKLSESHIAVSIADVSGKGVPGALLGASLRSAEKSLNGARLKPAAVCGSLNQTMLEIMPEGKFISFFYGFLNLDEKTLTYSNAGHNAPLLVRQDGSVTSLSVGGAVLGYFPKWNYVQERIQLQSGDRLVLFTDGVVEAGNQNDDEFGVHRLASVVSEFRNSTAAELRCKLMDAITQHCGGAFHDDTTILVVAIE